MSRTNATSTDQNVTTRHIFRELCHRTEEGWEKHSASFDVQFRAKTMVNSSATGMPSIAENPQIVACATAKSAAATAQPVRGASAASQRYAPERALPSCVSATWVACLAVVLGLGANPAIASTTETAPGDAACQAARLGLQSMSAGQRQRYTLSESSCASPTADVNASAESTASSTAASAKVRESTHLQLFQGQGSALLKQPAQRAVTSGAPWAESGQTGRTPPQRAAPSSGTSRAVQLSPAIDAVARRHNIDPLLMHAIAHVESRHNPQARSQAGALGVMQVMPTTGQRFGVEERLSLHHTPTNLEVSATYLKTLQERFGNNLHLVLAAYNAGEGAVERYGRRIPPYGETQRYVTAVLATYQNLTAAARQVRGRAAKPGAPAVTAM
jgi:soluble lytic murein transglycosylase-like protein